MYMPPGTACMTTLDKKYEILVYVRDFLGSQSEKMIAQVLKKGSSTPQIQFNPPSMTTTRDKEVMIKGEAVFSACPVEKSDLEFSWRQVSGPSVPESLLKTPLPQLQIPRDTLKEGSTYQFALKFSISTDRSKGSEY